MPADDQQRWKPSRAGILNVYQYQDEVLEFGDGRLLLRGVNGSGKSTAMNMLLPFLLEADVRKIDAAGEQRGVLRSWMLSDHDDTQRTGYLWIEFARGSGEQVEYRTVGCGIRANRSTDRVAVWWFSTDRRVRIDLRLTEADVPFSVDVLRSELGTRGQVFTSTAEYRAEIARRFFGGVDPGAYFRLLHQVRNPRVGDRIDTDLPRTLREALPPVPEDAVHDAAQPLEDLEDHRRNVTDLARTAEALDGAVEVYTDYARRVLMTEVEAVASALDIARSAARRVDRDRAGVEKATAAQEAATRASADLADEHAEATAERAGLAALPEYTAHADLVRRRDEVARADAHVATLDGHRARARERVVAAAGTVGAARGQLDSDLAGVAEHLRAVADAARDASAPGIAGRLPDPPAPVTEPRRDEAGETTVEVPTDDDPTAELDLTAVGDALRTHRTTVRAVAEHARGARRATEVAEAADTAAGEALAAHEAADEQAAAARRAARAAADEHAEAVAGWTRRLAEHVAAVPVAEAGGATGWLDVPAVPTDGPDDDLRRAAEHRRSGARQAADDVTGALDRARTRARTAVEEVDAELAGLRAEHQQVGAAGELPLPRAPWRTDDDAPDGVLLASLVDFREHLDDAERAGLEAALEASGLLTAHVDGDGTLRVGALVAGASVPTEGPALDTLLAPVDTGAVPPETVASVLAAVGTTAGPVRVSTDGTFAAGPLRGRHTKAAAEHVGAGARAQARECRLAELAATIAGAQARRDAADTVADALDAHADTLRRLVAELPATRGVDDAVAAATGAVRFADGAQDRHRELAVTAGDARRRADDAWTALSRAASEAGVPTDPDRLDGLLEAVSDAERALAAVDAARDRVGRTARAWREAVAAWERDAADHATAVGEHREAAGRAASVRTELATIEESLGEEPAKVAARVGELDERLRTIAARLEEAREEQTAAAVAVSKAEMTLEETRRGLDEKQRAARSARARLGEAAAVPGLLQAAERAGDAEETDEETSPEPLPSVADSVEGAEELVAALRERLPAPRRAVSEDALDKALRAARDELASGWDVESRRAADGMPLAVHVSGPSRAVLAQMVHRVAVQRRRATSLLSAQQDQALRNLLHGRIAREVADALFAARELVDRMNRILRGVTSSQGIGVRLDWRARGDLDPETATALELLRKHPDVRSPEEDDQVREAVKTLVEQARARDPEASYRSVIGEVLDYRTWHEMRLYLRRPGRSDELLTRRTTLSEGEKKLVTVLPMAAAAAASAAAHDPHGVGAPRLVLLDDAFAKVSEDNHAKLFGLLVDLDVDFVVTSERLWGTHPTVPALAITEVLRDPELRAIALVHYRWDGASLEVSA
ncbi:TIGR02680 family protein [Actinomycetospora lemnae]|uniref:TIGR02680 family protein n=1 Tax=Actinomycetospora lemnae TaxID=3019891 RepID=A0ABT5T023_9PSEU|nr:TIGR02680 family protein [Actinomycetospora sp. DW7H6]MDD7968471.1 TIGR02680 family protein [Actinomycetospora sp. DW7H6]